MIACYDLARCPPTYDVVAFLAHAELERLRRGENFIDIDILPGPASGFRRDSMFPRTIEERVHWRDDVVVPICKLLPSVRDVTVSVNRSVEGWSKGEYKISLPAIVSALKQGCRPLRYPVNFKYEMVTFTLREAEHHPLRNSRVGEWLEAAEVLRTNGVDVEIVPDASKQFLSIEDRARLYSRAKLNVGICNGPMWMSIFMDAPTLMLRPTTNEALGCYDDRFYAKWGIPRGSQLPNSPPHQRLVWEDDTCDNIVRAVEVMLADMESGSAA